MMDLIKHEVNRRSVDLLKTRRLFHGRGRCFPGYEDLVIDWYEPLVSVTLYRERTRDWVERLVELMREAVPAAEGIVLQKRYLKNSPSELVWGTRPDELYAEEAGLRYRLNIGGAQNIGFFPDMAKARRFVRDNAEGKKLLNLFAYTCSFSVAAVAGGARQVVNLDMSKGALACGRANHQLNRMDGRSVSYLSMELFRSFSKLNRLAPFDMIVCDPPGDQGSSFRPHRDWPRLARKLPALLTPGGLLLACVSSPHVTTGELTRLFDEEGGLLRLRDILVNQEDFPEREPDKGVRTLIYQAGTSPNRSRASS